MFQVKKNVLDVTYHVNQYQGIITELREEIGRLKEKIIVEGGNTHGKVQNVKQMEELKELRDEMVANFREQMKLRSDSLNKLKTQIKMYVRVSYVA